MWVLEYKVKGKPDQREAILVKNHCLAQLNSATNGYLFRQWLEYFAGKSDKLARAVSLHYTSQKCSNCGVIVKEISISLPIGLSLWR